MSSEVPTVPATKPDGAGRFEGANDGNANPEQPGVIASPASNTMVPATCPAARPRRLLHPTAKFEGATRVSATEPANAPVPVSPFTVVGVSKTAFRLPGTFALHVT